MKQKTKDMIRNLITIGLIAIFFASCNTTVNESSEEQHTLFEPADGEVILFIGQDLGAVGGLEDYNDGYFDHFDAPGGFTMYTNIRIGDESYGHTYKGLDGVTTTDNWGSGDCNMQMQIDDPDFDNSALAIGFELVNHDSLVGLGERDSLIIVLANWVKGLGNRPVFLRIGYEFDGFAWNFYKPENYKSAFKRVKYLFDSVGVENYVTVWQSKGFGSDTTELMKFYPGHEYVDWFGYSHFAGGQGGGQPMIDLARKYNKPLFIAEATPMINRDGKTIDCFFTDHDQAMRAWDMYFEGLFKTIDDNPDVIKAISYINVDWFNQAMWEKGGPFMHIDSRLHVNDSIKARWNRMISKDKYLKASPNLYNYLWGK